MTTPRAAAAVLIAGLVVTVAAGCGGGPGGGPQSGGGGGGGGAATAAPATGGPDASPPGGAGPGSNGGGPNAYTPNAATASVTVDGTAYELSGGTCKEDTTVYGTFELVIGELEDARRLDVFVSEMSEDPVGDGDHQGGLTLVTIGIDRTNHVAQATVTLRDGQTSGSFSGRTTGNAPTDISGTFSC